MVLLPGRFRQLNTGVMLLQLGCFYWIFELECVRNFVFRTISIKKARNAAGFKPSTFVM